MKTVRRARGPGGSAVRDRAGPADSAAAGVASALRGQEDSHGLPIRAAAAPRSRNFGPDAPPKNKRKPPRKDDRGPKGPIKARPVTTLYDEDEDWRAKDEEPLEIDDIATSKPGAAADVEVDVDDDTSDQGRRSKSDQDSKDE